MTKTLKTEYILHSDNVTIYCDKLERVTNESTLIWIGNKGYNAGGTIQTGSLKHNNTVLVDGVVVKSYMVVK